jgi:hypothetical protein
LSSAKKPLFQILGTLSNLNKHHYRNNEKEKAFNLHSNR